ncbi:hypothetical protein VPHD480_0318 [Vibrio phage D480]
MAGMGSRMGAISEIVPKGLINYHNHTFLYHIYRYYEDAFDECVVTVNSKFRPMLEQYAENFNLTLTIINDDTYDGNSNILHHCKGDVILNWCDVVPVDVDVRDLKSGVTVFTKDGTGRFVYDNGVTEVSTDSGDFCGIYAIRDCEYDIVNGDFVDVMIANNFDVDLRECDVVDLGSFDKLSLTQDTLPTARYFNEITYHDGVIRKRAVGDELSRFKISREIEVLKEGRVGYVELIDHDDDSYTMPVLYGTMPTRLTPPMINKGDDVSEDDIRVEISERVLSRIESITEYTHIDIDELRVKLHELESYVIENTHAFYDIHGDMICDNAFDTDNGVVFIDPRGYFGNGTRGPIEYDTSKFLYSVNGYFDFNYNVMYDGDFEKYDNHSEMSLLEEAWVATHWLALAGFFKNNPSKAIGAYHIGMNKLCRFIATLSASR